jgi:leucine dehydrogenase
MRLFENLEELGHEEVHFFSDPTTGYRAIIAIHSTVLGPAVGGTRLWRYPTEEEAVTDALRLSRGMTYKAAAAGLPLGGGKAVILSDARVDDREKLFRSHGRAVDRLGGRYITAEDVGTSPEDMLYVQRETEHVAGLIDRSGDPSPHTARGVFRAIQAAARHRLGSDELGGRTVALQGLGHVGYQLARELRAAGAELVVTDVVPERVERAVAELEARSVAPEAIYAVEADIFSPCALGGILNDQTLPQLRAVVVAGAANNQLLEPRHGEALRERGILYAPDYVANSGGLIGGTVELLGWEKDRARRKIEELYQTMLRIFERAEAEGITPARAADRLAEAALRAGGPAPQ